MTDQKKQPETPQQEHYEPQREDVPMRPSHMNQGNQTFRPDKEKSQDTGKQDPPSRRAS